MGAKTEMNLSKFFDEWIFGIKSSKYLANELKFNEILKKHNKKV